MTTQLDKQAAYGMVELAGGVAYVDGHPDFNWVSPNGRLIAVELKRKGDSWRYEQFRMREFYQIAGIPYVLARDEHSLASKWEAVCEFETAYTPEQRNGKWIPIEADQRLM